MVITKGQIMAHEVRLLAQGAGLVFKDQAALLKFEQDVKALLTAWYGDSASLIVSSKSKDVVAA